MKVECKGALNYSIRSGVPTQLLDQVWGPDYFGDERIADSYIKRIRKKLSLEASRPQFIRTVSGVGYSFNDTPDAA